MLAGTRSCSGMDHWDHRNGAPAAAAAHMNTMAPDANNFQSVAADQVQRTRLVVAADVAAAAAVVVVAVAHGWG